MSEHPESSRAPKAAADADADAAANAGVARRQKFVLKWLIFACVVGNLLVLLWAFSGKRR